MTNKAEENKIRFFESRFGKTFFIAVMIILPVATALLCIGLGRYGVTFSEIISVFKDKITGQETMGVQTTAVVWTMRLPRVILALLVGAGLSAAGVAFQSLFSNPLATPDTLGVAAGASLGAVIALFFGLNLIIVQILALISGFFAVFLTYFVGWRGNRHSMTSVVLAGLVISSLFSALVSFIKFVADTESQLPSITYWLMGSLRSASYQMIILGAPFILAGIIILFLLRWRMNVLPLSDDEAKATGTNLGLLRALTMLSATMITASAVSMCGQVGWVGLLVPHVCRMAFGSNTKTLVPASISLGAVFMVLIDTVARSLTASEIPISILTAIIGAPFFILLLRRTGGWSL